MIYRNGKLTRTRASLFFASLLFTLSSYVNAGSFDLSTARHAIESRGGRWVAGETSISELAPEMRRHRARLIKPSESEVQSVLPEQLTSSSEVFTLAPSLDWRNYNGINDVTAVRDQGNCGSCWAFATTAAIESQALISGASTTLNLAEQILVSCSGAGSCNGGYLDRASNYIREVGLPAESYFAYSASNKQCSSATYGWQNDTDRITAWHYVATTKPTVDLLKNALSTYGPLVTTMDVYSDFYYYKSGIYSHSGGTLQGGHAVLLIGYDDIDECFIVKNSWGTRWGEAGFFRIAYSELTSSVHFGYYTIAYEGYSGNTDPGPQPQPCNFTISPASATYTRYSGSGSIRVLTQSNCSWTAVSNVSWITVTSGASGAGNGTVVYSVQSNRGSQRSGTISVAGQVFTVTQAGRR